MAKPEVPGRREFAEYALREYIRELGNRGADAKEVTTALRSMVDALIYEYTDWARKPRREEEQR